MIERTDALRYGSSPAHSTVLVQAFLQIITSSISVSPSFNPDLAPCDFWLFPKLNCR
jgi:hypothetical protein